MAVFRLALALLSRFKSELLSNTDIAFVAQFFHHLKDKREEIDIKGLLEESLGFGLTDEGLDALEAMYFAQMASQKVNSTEPLGRMDPQEAQYVQSI